MSTVPHTVNGTADEIADADVITEGPAPVPGMELATHEPATEVAIAPRAEASELVVRLGVITDAMHTSMKEGVDYGKVPGTDKPTLLKPGAEKLGVLFRLDVQFTDQQTWDGPHLTVISNALVFDIETGKRVGSGSGLCTTREKKYGRRRAQRTCPACGQPAVIKGKAEYGGGWVCFKKKDGCGAKYPDGDQQIEGQQVGDVENPDLADTWNTVLKMARKRARVDAILATTGASAIFTQDAEDLADVAPAPEPVQLPGWALPIGDVTKTRAAVTELLGTPADADAVGQLLATLAADTDGKVVSVVNRALLHTVVARRSLAQPQAHAEQPTATAPAAAVQTTLDTGGPRPGTVPQPPMQNTPVADIKAFREAGCICASPLEAGGDDEEAVAATNPNCPINGHGTYQGAAA